MRQAFIHAPYIGSLTLEKTGDADDILRGVDIVSNLTDSIIVKLSAHTLPHAIQQVDY